MGGIDSVKNLLGVKDETEFDSIIETAVDQIPLIGKVFTSFKISRLSKRLKESSSKLSLLEEKVSIIDDIEFLTIIREFVFPMILDSLIEEDEDDKIGLFLDGFGTVLDQEKISKSKILIFYDILKQLRLIEVRYLQSFNFNDEIDVNFLSDEFETIRLPIEKKLQSLGLLTTPNLSYKDIISKFDMQSSLAERGMSYTPREEVVMITGAGYEFLSFIKLAK